MIIESKEPVIIVLSDAHLGASKSEFQLLYEFLRGINGKKYEKDVKALIILGDFFDICMRNCSDIRVNYFYILDELLKLQGVKIPVIFSLGNHEISVTGDIERNFVKHKNSFINDFDKRLLLNEDNIGQYIEVRKEGTNLDINLYNSLKRFDKDDKTINSFPISRELEEAGDFKCLLTHGHQLEHRIVRWFAGGLFWGRLIKSRDSHIKKFVDTLWNSVLSGSRSVLGLTKDDINYLASRVKLVVKKKRFIRRCIYRILKWEKRKTKNKNRRYFKRIGNLIKKKGRYQKLTHFVFGHTHKLETKTIRIKNKDLKLANSGGWQKIIKPSYLEINLKKFEIYRKRMKLTHDLRLLRFFNKIFEAMGLAYRTNLIENHIDNQKELVDCSQLDIFKFAKDKELITQDNLDHLQNHNQYQQDYINYTTGEINIKDVLNNIEDLRNIYQQTLM